MSYLKKGSSFYLFLDEFGFSMVSIWWIYSQMSLEIFFLLIHLRECCVTLECVFRDCMPYLKASLAFFTQKATSFGQEATHKKGDVHRENQEQPLIPSNWSSLVFCMWLDSLWLDFPIKNLLAVNLSKS